MSVVIKIKEAASAAIQALYHTEITADKITVNATRPEFEGDYTIVVFSLVKQFRKAPDAAAAELGTYLTEKHPDIFASFNVIKGFLNLVIHNSYWLQFLAANYSNASFGYKPANGKKVMVEYSSPNTNKPLHLGHLRNNFLGWSTAEILKADGYDIVKTCIANDRGIHICKSMVAWQLFGNGATPVSTGIKGDHLVGDYYVMFGNEYKRQVNELMEQGMAEEAAKNEAPIMKAAQQMLVAWEAGEPGVMELWAAMNSWVYKGFEETYKRIGSNFDKTYYESDTYLLGKNLVQYGLDKKVFFTKEDGSVWIDLTADGLDEKIVQRRDGTAVYITQDIGLAQQKHEEFNPVQSIYVVGNEQDYHFNVLRLICQKLGIPGADGIYHLSYGMVELPTGKMKTREGTVVDADDMVDEMVNVAKAKTEELGKIKDFTEEELVELYDTIGLGALKFFLLRVDPKKRILFNPEESIDFHGFTAPYIQFTYARTKSILRRLAVSGAAYPVAHSLLSLEKEVIIQLEQFDAVISEAAREHDPSKVAIYIFNVSRLFTSFLTEHSVANAENESKKELRLQLAHLTAQTIKTAMHVLGIKVPERM